MCSGDGRVFIVFWISLFLTLFGIVCVGVTSSYYKDKNRSSTNDPELACIASKGNWVKLEYGSPYTCKFGQ
jgi:hypothetical protein